MWTWLTGGESLFWLVVGSIHLVHLAIALGRHWGVPDRIVGVLILAALTGLPNIVAALRLARRGRVLIGVCLAGVVLGVPRASPPLVLSRIGGALLCSLYAAFAVVIVAAS